MYHPIMQTKEAVPAWLAGPLGHVGVNALGRHAHKATNLAEVMAHKGLQHGTVGKGMGTMAQRSMNAILGPEAGVQYALARKAGEKLYGLPPAQRKKAMQAIEAGGDIGSTLGLSAADMGKLKDAPLIGPIAGALKHEAAGTSPTLTSSTRTGKLYGKAVDALSNITTNPFQTKTQRAFTEAAGALPLAALGAIDPGGAAWHAGTNTARELVGRSSFGKKVQKGLLTSGLQGNKPSRAKEMFTDYAASPAFLDSQRLGKAVHDAGLADKARSAMSTAEKAVPTAQSVGRVTGQSPEVSQAVQALQGAQALLG